MIRTIRFLAIPLGMALLFGLNGLAQREKPAPVRMTDAATQFLASLSPELKKKASFAFDDDHRVKWWFTPQQDKQKQFTRKGVRFEEMTEEQQKAALNLLRSGTSDKGYTQATTVMSLESILNTLEGTKGALTRNPSWYFVSIFGEPSATGKWGWRFEGHHLSINVTLDRGQVQTMTPYFFGSNPAIVKSGPRAGLKPMPEVQELAKDLIVGFSAKQSEKAKVAKDFPEIAEGTTAAKVGSPVGIAASDLTESQVKQLKAVLKAYADRLPAEIAAVELERVEKSPLDQLYFAFSGVPEFGQKFTYRIHGPSYLVEFINVQADSAGNPANHIHSSWRHLPSDFGLVAN
jgi:hypothetical protein